MWDLNTLYRFHDGTAFRIGLLASVNYKKNVVRVVVMDSPVKLVKITGRDIARMTEIEYTGRRRNVANAYLDAGKRLGITKSARKALNNLRR